MDWSMELRHLRYLIAVAEEGSLTLAAERRLHTAQPSLRRQIRDLELEVGAQLLIRGPRGIELTPAGQAFLDQARLALSQVEVAGEAARRASQVAKESFVLGFMTGHEVTWLPEALRILRDDQPNIEVIVHSQLSPDLARGLPQGKLDVAFLRREDHAPGLAFKLLTKEPPSSFCPAIIASPRTIPFARTTFRAKPSSVFPRRHHLLSGPSSTAMRRAPDSILLPNRRSIIFRWRSQ
jgi:LysR family transcriptional regulator, hca operon transcriptional activator